MKKDNKYIRSNLLENLVELLLPLLSLFIGIVIVSLFGMNIESPDTDYDLIILIGLIAIFIVFGSISACVQWLKKIIRGKHK